jgi:tetratricopeptide (TPR) repeat protein
VVAAIHARGAVAAAPDRFVPADPGFVVASIRETQPDDQLRPLLDAWRANRSATTTAALATAFIERARSRREPTYFGRAEAVLAPLASRPGAAAPLRRLYAEVLQYRHDFSGAEKLLDMVLEQQTHDVDARLMRASVRLVRGDFEGARADCAQLAASGGDIAVPGFACFAEALAGGGELERALDLLSLPAHPRSLAPAGGAYLLATRAELRERGDNFAGAIADYRTALSLAPADDSIRAALADTLVASGMVDEARRALAVDKAGVALLVRSAALAQGPQRAELASRAASWLALEAARGDAQHLREAAMLALVNGEPARALAAARANFEIQKELPDIRVLARAASVADDTDALSALRQWLLDTGYRDSVTESIVGDASRS